MNKKKIVTVLIVIATVILAGVAVYTAIRLYQLRQEAVAPTAPEESEAAAPITEECSQLVFTITQESPSPSPSPSPTESPSPSPSPTASPTASPTTSPIAQASPSPTEEAALPEAGVSYPTIVGAGAGIILILLSLLLAL